MTTATQSLRDRLISHEHWDPYGTALQLLDIIDAQQEQINNLRETMSNQYQRQGNQIADLRKEVDRLKGVHGA